VSAARRRVETAAGVGRPGRPDRRFRAGLLAAAVLGLIQGLVQGSAEGWTTAPPAQPGSPDLTGGVPSTVGRRSDTPDGRDPGRLLRRTPADQQARSGA